jgi:hypothetical protein
MFPAVRVFEYADLAMIVAVFVGARITRKMIRHFGTMPWRSC